MKIDLERFLTITALLASTSAVGACSSDDAAGAGPTGSGGSDSGAGGSDSGAGGSDSGAGGSDSGAGGSGGTATGGAIGTDASTPDASTPDASAPDASAPDASAPDGTAPDGTAPDATTCLSDDAAPWLPPANAPDGFSGSRCDLLPVSCSPDAGSEGTLGYGYAYCSHFSYLLRPGITDALLTCIEEIATFNGDPCSSSYRYAADDCFREATNKACPQTIPPSGDAGGDLCDAISGTCSEVTAERCRSVLSSFSGEGYNDLLRCLDAAVLSDAGCASNFWSCVLPPGIPY